MLEQKVPEAVPPGEKTIHELSFSLLLRHDLESLVWDFDSLFNTTNKEGDPTRTVDQAVETCVKLYREIGAPYLKQEIESDGAKGVLYDFSDAFSRLAPGLATLSATTIYSIIEIDGRKLAYRGVSDFFPNRNRSLASISLSKNEAPEIYMTLEAGEAQAQDRAPVMDAPILGKKEYLDCKADDRFSARFVVNSIGVPRHSGMMEVLRIYVDAELEIAHGYLIPDPRRSLP